MTMAGPSKRAKSKCELVPINLHITDEFEELRQQRIVCGWNYDTKTIEGWREAISKKTKSLFWITIPSTTEEPSASKLQRAGHVSLDSVAEPPDPDLANSDKTVLTIATFFINPSFRAGGLGRNAMVLLESYATKEPYGSSDCKTVAVTTLNKRYWEEDEYRSIWGLTGREAPARGSSNEDWYTRMGYVKWKEEPRYPQRGPNGEEVKLLASFLRKRLQ